MVSTMPRSTLGTLPDSPKVGNKVKRLFLVGIACVALSISVAGCAGTHQNDNAGSTPGPTSSASSAMNLTPGGTFATQPAAPGGFLTQAQALAAARASTIGLLKASGVSATKADSTTSAAPASVATRTYGDLLKALNNQSAHQLATDNSIIEVTLQTPVPAGSLPAPAGMTRPTGWSQISYAYDARTGLTLWEGPTPLVTN